MRLTFLGGTGTVTGSKYLLEHDGHRMLVDCGLFQGLKQLRLRNWAALPVEPGSLDAIVLTHAHLDHSGYIPRLDRSGFDGHVYCTAATRDLCGLLLPDSGHLLEEEAEYANRHGFSKHRPALPLYTEEDARVALAAFRPIAFDAPFEPIPGVTVRLRHAGHLLGAASVHVARGQRSILFSGDLGRQDDLLMKPPAPPVECDWLVIESTYGNRVHAEVDALETLADVVRRTASRGGIVVVPSFAVGRAQAIMYALHQLRAAHRIPAVPTFLDSPMAADATRLYSRHRAEHRLDDAQCEAMCRAAKIVNTVEESKHLDELRMPSIIISASGMATGGRVLHHLKAYATDPRNSIVFAGYQAAGTRGSAIVGGADAVKIHGRLVPVRAEVACLDSLSAHADREELIAWAGALRERPRHVFVTHGEPEPADTLRRLLQERCTDDCSVPEYLDVVDLDGPPRRA